MGKRDRATTYQFLADLRNRLAEEHRFQLTTDGFGFYRKGVEDVFAEQANFAQMIKRYGDYSQHDAAGRYSPAPMRETIVKMRDGLTRATQAVALSSARTSQSAHGNPSFHQVDQCFLKELDDHKAACALHFAYYNFCPIH